MMQFDYVSARNFRMIYIFVGRVCIVKTLTRPKRAGVAINICGTAVPRLLGICGGWIFPGPGAQASSMATQAWTMHPGRSTYQQPRAAILHSFPRPTPRPTGCPAIC